jgi:putative ABC transport system permease protein
LLLRAPGLQSFLIVTPGPGVSTENLRDQLQVPGTDAILKSEVVSNDRALMARVYDAPIALMVTIAFIVGVLVVGLVIYTATSERRREYGAVKAVGAGNATLYKVVLVQALIAAGAGVLIGAVLTALTATALMTWRPQFLIQLEWLSIVAVTAAGLMMAVLAALIPARTISRLEPAEVFRR